MDESLLGPYRALDLTDDKGFLCGRILADLGADVIKIERPGGDPSRNIGPFYGDSADPEKSLFWFASNANKRGVTLDIEAPEGKALFKRLVEKADFVIESFPPGYLEGLGLGYHALFRINPALIMTSITPFGQTGPYRDYKASDLVGMALGGIMSLTGDPDRPPVRIGFPQAYLHASAEGAMGSLIAFHHRQETGLGQHVDVSMQEAVVPTMMNSRPFWEMNKVNLKRAGPFRVGLSSDIAQPQTWPCRDGFVTFLLLGGRTGAKTMQALTAWMESEGMAPPYLKEMDWEAYDMATVTQEEMDLVSEPIANFFKAHTKGELYEGALRWRVMLYPALSPREVAGSPQLAARGFWVRIEHPELGTALTYPGPFLKASEAPLRMERRAPLIGEHNEEVYLKELGLSREELADLKRKGIV